MQKLGQQATGWLVICVLGGLLLMGWQASSAEETISFTAEDEPTTNFAIEPENAPIWEEELPIITDDSLAPALDPTTYQGERPQHELQTYVVQAGDTPTSIAEQFGIQPETILGGNGFLSEESSLLQTGVTLTILPQDGVLHTVQTGDTLEGLVERYGIPRQLIVAYEPNNLSFPYRLYPDTQIFVPGAVRELFVWTPPDLSDVVAKTSGIGSGVTPVVVGTGSFRYPVNARNFTQYFWYGHQGIDIALLEGSAVYAADTGTVTYAGWNEYGYGNLIVVNHGNGYETFYAHLSSFNVRPGQIVYKGNVIGGSGNTGRSSGPHIHFEIRYNNGRENPCWYIGC